MNKRTLIKASVALTANSIFPIKELFAKEQNKNNSKADDMTTHAVPIGSEERKKRVKKAQKIMKKNNIDALLMEAGSALIYFTGVKWRRSERFTGLVIPREGDLVFVTPYFEEPTIRESMALDAEVRTWHEHEDPFKMVADILMDKSINNGKLAIEETTRHFIVDGIEKVSNKYELISGNDITRGCRMYKSDAELNLMQIANNITMNAYRYVYQNIELGMSPQEISFMMSEKTREFGGTPKFSSVLLNEASAYPHGTRQPQRLKKDGIILMDSGCSVHDYQSDISRTWTFGSPTKKQRRVWSTAKRGQELALETAQIGVPAGNVDDAVRKFYETQGYGPDYKTPGLSHRLGHGIGIDGHEPINFVRGEKTPLAKGMCFSNEPGIYIFGEFGVRLEDCLYLTDDGPRLFTDFSKSIDNPFG
tara:strand:- start:325 stop:1584 length:1260 start_codon:yes stop_codon:yes gene_type:complete